MYLEMLCKENIVTWFKDLTSFKRIDVMCNLLQTCQPFETRFLGTCIEELGRKDFALLRQIENIVNNPVELGTQDLNNINDKETRSKISQFLCVLHSTNKRCANEMYNILVKLYEDVNNIIKSGAFLREDSLIDELLLIYALGIFHPAFSFEKKMYIGDLLMKLLQEEERIQIFKQKEMLSPEHYPSDNIVMTQMPEPLPNLVSEEPMLNSLPPLSTYIPTIPSVISHSSSPSGSPPIRTKPPVTPVDHKSVSPNPRLMNETDLPPPPLGMPPPGVKDTRLLTNGKPNEELWLQTNMRRQAYVLPVFYSPSPSTPPTPSTCPSSAPVTPSTCSSCHNGAPVNRPLTSPPAPGPVNDMRLAGDQRLISDQMRELRLGEIPFPAETGNHYSPGQSSSGESNNSESSPPSPPPHDIGRGGLPPMAQYSSRSSSRGSNLSLGAPNSAHQYRRRPEMNGHEPGPPPGTDGSNFYQVLTPQPTFIPPPPTAYPLPIYPPGAIFPEALMMQYPPGPPPNLGPAMYSHTLPAPPKVTSCYNCGSQSHVAPECPDPTIDEVSKQGQYRLDYEGSVNQFNNSNDNN